MSSAFDATYTTVERDGSKIVLYHRAAVIVAFIAVEATRINRIRCGSLTLHWDGDSLRPEWRETGERFTLADRGVPE